MFISYPGRERGSKVSCIPPDITKCFGCLYLLQVVSTSTWHIKTPFLVTVLSCPRAHYCHLHAAPLTHIASHLARATGKRRPNLLLGLCPMMLTERELGETTERADLQEPIPVFPLARSTSNSSGSSHLLPVSKNFCPTLFTAQS